MTVAIRSTKTLALIIIFAALAIALNVYGPKIPFPLAPFLYFQFWEIPIVIAFLLIGVRTGIAVAAINTVILFAVFPGPLPSGPIYNFIAVMATVLGLFIPYLLARRGCKSENIGIYFQKHIKAIMISATALGVTLRVVAMSIVNYFALQQPYPFGFEFTELATIALIPVIALFNAIIVAYTIPIALGITKALESRIKIPK